MIDRPLRLLGLVLVLILGGWAVTRHWPATPKRTPLPAHVATATPAPPLLSESRLRPGSPVTTPDDAFTVRVERISRGTARLVVTAKTRDVYRFDPVSPGSRLVVPAPHGTYHLDVLRIGSDGVYVTMYAQPQAHDRR